MSQTIAICVCDPEEALSVVCLYLCQFAFPITPLCHCPANVIHAPNQSVRPWLPLTPSVLRKGERGQLTGRIQGSQTRLLPTCFAMRDPEKMLCRERLWETLSCVVSCHSRSLCSSLGQELLEAVTPAFPPSPPWHGLCGRILWTGVDLVGNLLSQEGQMVQYILLCQAVCLRPVTALPLLQLRQGWVSLVQTLP